MEERGTELLIKEETLKENMGNPDHQGELNNGDRTFRPVGGSCDRGDEALVSDMRHTPDGEVGAPRIRQEVWDVTGPDCIFKTENNSVTKMLQCRGTEHRAEGLSSLDSEFVMFERAGQLGPYCTQGGAITETEDPCCSYSTAEGRPAEERRINGLPSLHSNTRGLTDTVKVTAETLSALGERAVPGPALKHRPYKRTADREATQLDSDGASHPSHTQTPGREHHVNRFHPNPETLARKSLSFSCRAGTGERLFICSHCGKSFSRPRNLETHLRVHTGEKPFGCTQCGKRFSQLCSLKTHLSVHTGERPFRCAHCGKRFAQPGYLKRHQTVHTGEKPFRCIQCDKSFSFLSNLIRHQGLHAGGKGFTGSL